jgi:hypothetical protein
MVERMVNVQAIPSSSGPLSWGSGVPGAGAAVAMLTGGKSFRRKAEERKASMGEKVGEERSGEFTRAHEIYSKSLTSKMLKKTKRVAKRQRACWRNYRGPVQDRQIGDGI